MATNRYTPPSVNVGGGPIWGMSQGLQSINNALDKGQNTFNSYGDSKADEAMGSAIEALMGAKTREAVNNLDLSEQSGNPWLSATQRAGIAQGQEDQLEAARKNEVKTARDNLMQGLANDPAKIASLLTGGSNQIQQMLSSENSPFNLQEANQVNSEIMQLAQAMDPASAQDKQQAQMLTQEMSAATDDRYKIAQNELARKLGMPEYLINSAEEDLNVIGDKAAVESTFANGFLDPTDASQAANDFMSWAKERDIPVTPALLNRAKQMDSLWENNWFGSDAKYDYDRSEGGFMDVLDEAFSKEKEFYGGEDGALGAESKIANYSRIIQDMDNKRDTAKSQISNNVNQNMYKSLLGKETQQMVPPTLDEILKPYAALK